MTDDRHPEDCLACRIHALGFTDAQLELLNEVLAAGVGAGWKERGLILRPPSERKAGRAYLLALHIWAELFGTPIPESDEVRTYREHGHD